MRRCAVASWSSLSRRALSTRRTLTSASICTRSMPRPSSEVANRCACCDNRLALSRRSDAFAASEIRNVSRNADTAAALATGDCSRGPSGVLARLILPISRRRRLGRAQARELWLAARVRGQPIRVPRDGVHACDAYSLLVELVRAATKLPAGERCRMLRGAPGAREHASKNSDWIIMRIL